MASALPAAACMKSPWLISLLLTTGCVATEQPSSTDDGKADKASNKQVVYRLFDDLNAFLAEPDPAAAEPLLQRAFEVVSDDVAWWVPDDTKPDGSRLPFAGTKSKAVYRDQVVRPIQSGFNSPDPGDRLHFAVVSVLAEGDQVAAEVESDGLHVSGKRYANRYHFRFRIERGSIVEVKEYMDTLHLGWLISR
jgi:ketosteroid isomerase-like protein